MHGFFPETAQMSARVEHDSNLLVAQPSPALGDIPQIGTLTTLPDQGLDQLAIIDQTLIVEKQTEFQGAAGQFATVEMGFARRRAPAGSAPRSGALRCRRAAAEAPSRLGGLRLSRSRRSMSTTGKAQAALPLLKEVAKQFISRRNLLKEPGLSTLLSSIPNKNIGVGFLNPLPIGGLDPAWLQIGQEIQRKVDLRPKQGTTSFENFGFREDSRQILILRGFIVLTKQNSIKARRRR